MEAYIEEMAEQAYVCIDDFITESAVQAIKDHIDALRVEGAMKKAGIGSANALQVQSEIRGDYIHWLEPDLAAGEIKRVLDRVEEMKYLLNSICFLGIRSYEAHLALYPPGAGYRRHRDRFRQHAHRLVSFVCYLNQNWKKEDGGVLRIYLPDTSESVDIEPVAGRCVWFKSEIEHEVLPAQKNRYSLTGWMLDREPGLVYV